jgi:hypothetical protein
MLKIEVSSVAEGGQIATEPPRRWALTPAVFILVPVILSFGGWIMLASFIGLGNKNGYTEMLAGFDDPAALSIPGIALLLLWYGVVLSVSTIGWHLGRAKIPDPELLARTSTETFERRYFLLLLPVAMVGVAYCYYKIGSANNILESLSSENGNDFTKSLSQTAGVQTLRYATILVAPIAIYLWRKKVIKWPMMVGSVVLLLLNALIAHRLSLLMASVVYLVIWARSRESKPRMSSQQRRRLIGALVAIVLVGFGTLTALNYFRNAQYYRVAGVENPFEMNMYQMGAYLGVPAQASLGVSDAIMNGSWEVHGDHQNSLNAVEPTFLQFTKVSKDNSWKGGDFYGYSVRFSANFFTNSVFADTYAVYGLWGWLYTIALYGFAGWLMARLIRLSCVIAGTGGVVAYTFSEVWRIQIVSYGFVIFLLLLTWGCTVLASWGLDREAREAVEAAG